MIFLGLDPGVSGAIAAIDEDGNYVWLCDIQPSFSYMREKLQAEVLQAHEDSLLAAIEVQHAFPGMKVSSTWALAEGYAYCRYLLESLYIPYQVVSPPKWQREVCGSLPRDRKQRKAAISVWAQQRWPTAELRTPRGRLWDGRSDALCIAFWIRQQNLGKEA